MEILDVVNENDEVVGQADFEEVFEKLLPHRIIHILIFNDSGEMALQLRSEKKSFCPLHWSTAVGGHVQTGESYIEGALRELEEELGETFEEKDLKVIGKDYYTDTKGNKMFLTTFRVDGINGPFEYNPDEVVEVRYFTMQELTGLIKAGGKFHPELKFLLEKHFAN